MSARLKELREEAARLEDEFVAACRSAGFVNQWEAYRTEQATGRWPASVEAAHKAYITAQHDFYALRDGPKGFLGGKGL